MKVFMRNLGLMLLIASSNQIVYGGLLDSLKKLTSSAPKTPQEYLNKAMKDTQNKLKSAQSEHAKLTGPKSKFQKLTQEKEANDLTIQKIDAKIEQAIEKGQSTSALESEYKIASINKNAYEAELNALKKQINKVESKLSNAKEELKGLQELQAKENLSIINQTNRLEVLPKIDVVTQSPIENQIPTSTQVNDANLTSDSLTNKDNLTYDTTNSNTGISTESKPVATESLTLETFGA